MAAEIAVSLCAEARGDPAGSKEKGVVRVREDRWVHRAVKVNAVKEASADREAVPVVRVQEDRRDRRAVKVNVDREAVPAVRDLEDR